jgi:hypothetical protein
LQNELALLSEGFWGSAQVMVNLSAHAGTLNTTLAYSPSISGLARRQMISRFSCPRINAIGYVQLRLTAESVSLFCSS